MFLDGEDERDGDRSGTRPPAIAAASAAGGLTAGQHDRRREEHAAAAKFGCVIVGAPKARKPVQLEWLEALTQTSEVEARGVHAFAAFAAAPGLPSPAFHSEGPVSDPSSTISRSPAVTIEPGP